MNNTYKIISIDPGNNIGVSIYELTADTHSVVSIETKTIVLNNYAGAIVLEDRLLEKLIHINKVCNELYNTHSPLALVVESAFLNSKFPKAVMQLSQYIATIELVFKQNNQLIKIFRYPPKLVKARIANNGNADKNMMLASVNKIEEITKKVNTNLLTEHEIDSLAIGYTAILEFRKNPVLLYKI